MTRRAKYHKALIVWNKWRKIEKRSRQTFQKSVEFALKVRPKKNAEYCYKYYKEIADRFRKEMFKNKGYCDAISLCNYVEALDAL